MAAATAAERASPRAAVSWAAAAALSLASSARCLSRADAAAWWEAARESRSWSASAARRVASAPRRDSRAEAAVKAARRDAAGWLLIGKRRREERV